MMSTNRTGNSPSWTREQNKAFENGLAIYSEDSSDRWEKIAAMVPGKTVEEIKHHYVILVEDINAIESGSVPLPCYDSSFNDSTSRAGNFGVGKKGGQFGQMQSNSCHGGKSSRSDRERRKGIAWTEEEHRLFLLGLENYGRGDWRNISRNFVVSRTPTQVASHAQKYFIHLSSADKKRRRPSIHDITSAGGAAAASTSQGPIMGQMNGPATWGWSSGSGKQAPSSEPDLSMFVPPTIFQSIDSPSSLISSVGTQLDLPSAAEMVYGVRARTPESLVSGTPRNMASMTCLRDQKG